MSFKDHVLFLSDDEYRQIDAFSYSLLKAIDDEGPMAMVERIDKKSRALEFGTMVDILLTHPEDKDRVFHTKAIEKPTAMLLQLADALLMDALVYDQTAQDIDEETINNKITSLGLWSNVKDPIKIKEKWYNDLFLNYIGESIAAKGKIITSPELLDAATHSANILLSHEYTKHYFQEEEGCEVLKQVCILYPFKGVQGKAKLDLVNIDHNKKTISVFDIKTGSELPSKFMNSFYHFKYYLQVVSYLLATEYIRSSIVDFKDYVIEPFRFLYLSKKLTDTPTIWEVPTILLNNFADGWDNNRGFMSLVDDYKFYKENDIYYTERNVKEKNGILKIELK